MRMKTGLFGFYVIALLLVCSSLTFAIRALSRQYQTSCTTRHSDFPKLNDFGKAFKDAGFKFPTDNESFLKIPASLLGAPAQKDQLPHTVWPGSIPGVSPVGLRMNTFFQKTSANRGQFASMLAPGSDASPFIPKTGFSTGFFSIFSGGDFGSDIAFWVDNDISISGDNSQGHLGDAYLRFVNIGRLVRLPKDFLTLRVGQFEMDLPFTQARSYDISPFDIYSQANVGAASTGFVQHNVTNLFTFASGARGVEFSGGHQYGGYHYSIVVVDPHTPSATHPTNTIPPFPSPTR